MYEGPLIPYTVHVCDSFGKELYFMSAHLKPVSPVSGVRAGLV